MRKVYVIGGGNTSIEKIREITATPINVEIVCVENMEDIPFGERLSSNPTAIQTIHNITLRPEIPDIQLRDIWPNKTKGHERPYKFHK